MTGKAIMKTLLSNVKLKSHKQQKLKAFENNLICHKFYNKEYKF